MSPPPPDSPYAPPASRLDTGPPEKERLASTGQRFADYLVDYVTMVVLYVVLGSVTGVLDGQTRGESVLLSSVLFLFYYAVLESLFGTTVGKLLTGVRVVSEDGGEPSLAQILGRTFARMIPFEPFSLLGGQGRPVGWHDSLSRTRVIRIR